MCMCVFMFLILLNQDYPSPFPVESTGRARTLSRGTELRRARGMDLHVRTVWTAALSQPSTKSTPEAVSSAEKESYSIITGELKSSQAHITVNQIQHPRSQNYNTLPKKKKTPPPCLDSCATFTQDHYLNRYRPSRPTPTPL